MSERIEKGDTVFIRDVGEDDFPMQHRGRKGTADEEMEAAPFEWKVVFNDGDYSYFNEKELQRFCPEHDSNPVYNDRLEEWVCPFCEN